MLAETLYISDMDGTLLDPEATLSPYSKNVLQNLLAQGLQFTVATARTFGSAGEILKDVPLSLPVILMNGVLVYDPVKQQYLKRCPIAPEAVQAIIAGLKQAGVTGLMYALQGDSILTYFDEDTDSDFINTYMESRLAVEPKRVFLQLPFHTVQSAEIIYFTLHGTYPQIAPAIDFAKDIPGLSHACYSDIYHENQWYLEIFSSAASKRNGALFLKEAYGYPRLVGFGDNLNDLPLFAACNCRVAVANAQAQVKAAADAICGANREDGVVKWMAAHAGLQVTTKNK